MGREVHKVIVIESGVVREGCTYSSLSVVARHNCGVTLLSVMRVRAEQHIAIRPPISLGGVRPDFPEGA